MGGFERFVVLEPMTSGEVQAAIRSNVDNPSVPVPLTLQPEEIEGVRSLHPETRTILFITKASNYLDPRFARYTGETTEGHSVVVTVARGAAASHTPARATLVRGSD